MNTNVAVINMFIAAACCCGCDQEQAQPRLSSPVVPGTNTPVELLVEQLVSPVPARFPNGEWERLSSIEDSDGYIHPQVEKAREQLVAMGTEIYPALAEHIRDDRYSYSGIYSAWLNLPVGTVIGDIMADGVEPHLGSYKWRANPTGSNVPPNFDQMAREYGGYEKYAMHAKGRSKPELRKEYVRWHVAKERGYGFANDEQEKKVIGEYLKLLDNN